MNDLPELKEEVILNPLTGILSSIFLTNLSHDIKKMFERRGFHLEVEESNKVLLPYRDDGIHRIRTHLAVYKGKDKEGTVVIRVNSSANESEEENDSVVTRLNYTTEHLDVNDTEFKQLLSEDKVNFANKTWDVVFTIKNLNSWVDEMTDQLNKKHSLKGNDDD